MTRWTLLCLVPLLAAAGPPVDPDWPCQQRLVPHLTAGALWPGPAPQKNWQDDPAVAALAQRAADRRTPIDEAVAALKAFADQHAAPELRAELFTGLVARSNDARDIAIARIKDVSRQLQKIADKVGDVTKELNALPADAPADRRREIVDRRALMIREYDSINRTVRYACEIPVDFEQRLGRFATVLRGSH